MSWQEATRGDKIDAYHSCRIYASHLRNEPLWRVKARNGNSVAWFQPQFNECSGQTLNVRIILWVSPSDPFFIPLNFECSVIYGVWRVTNISHQRDKRQRFYLVWFHVRQSEFAVTIGFRCSNIVRHDDLFWSIHDFWSGVLFAQRTV